MSELNICPLCKKNEGNCRNIYDIIFGWAIEFGRAFFEFKFANPHLGLGDDIVEFEKNVIFFVKKQRRYKNG